MFFLLGFFGIPLLYLVLVNLTEPPPARPRRAAQRHRPGPASNALL